MSARKVARPGPHATLGPMGKTFKQLRDEAMADPKRRAAIEREEKELRERVNRSMKENAEVMELKKS